MKMPTFNKSDFEYSDETPKEEPDHRSNVTTSFWKIALTWHQLFNKL